MRFYLKLLVLFAVTFAAQSVASVDAMRDLWFNLRCDYAMTINDQALKEVLVREASLRRDAGFDPADAARYIDAYLERNIETTASLSPDVM